MAGTKGISDLRTVDLVNFDLEKRRIELEQIVAPHVTTKNTGTIVGFKGKRRYLKTLPPGVILYVLALQHLYAIQAAVKARDINKLIRVTCLFARAALRLEIKEDTGEDIFEASYAKARQRVESRRGADAANKRKAARRPNFAATVNEGLALGMVYNKAVERAASIHDRDEKTIRNHVPNLNPQNRGRWKKGRKNAERLS